MKTEKLGTVWIARAKLYNDKRKPIGYCLDTPNAIAKAFMEHSEAEFVKGYLENKLKSRKCYEDRMKDWNIAKSEFSS